MKILCTKEGNMSQKSSEYFVRDVIDDEVFQEPPQEYLRKIEIALSTENDPIFCQVCESVELLIDISKDAYVLDELGKMLVIRDERVDKLLKYLCQECDTKICEMIDLKKKYMGTYEKVLTRIVCTDKVNQQEEVLVTSPEEAPAEEPMFEDSNIVFDPVPEKCSEKVAKLRVFTCDYCGKSSKYKAALKNHKVSHVQQENAKKRTTASQSHKCTKCVRCFAQTSYLNQHMLTHTKEKPHKCRICSKCFNDPSNLRRHMLIHTGKKPFICGICTTSFRRKDTLKTHMMIHTEEKPFICGICPTSFRHKYSLRMHMMIHTGGKSHKCTKCDQDFARKSSLNRHIRRFHPENN